MITKKKIEQLEDTTPVCCWNCEYAKNFDLTNGTLQCGKTSLLNVWVISFCRAFKARQKRRSREAFKNE